MECWSIGLMDCWYSGTITASIQYSNTPIGGRFAA
jgi:hypothetical protein